MKRWVLVGGLAAMCGRAALAEDPKPLVKQGTLVGGAMRAPVAGKTLLGSQALLALTRRNGIPLVLVDAAPKASMTGWTRLTNGATLGGPSVIQAVNKTTSLIVRAADGGVYMATINPTNPGGVLDGGAWVAIGGKVASEPACFLGMSFGTTACAWLDAKTNVIWGTMQYETFSSENVLGPDGVGARPSVDYAEQTVSQPNKGYQAGTRRHVELSVWAGKQIYLRRRETFLPAGDITDTRYHSGLNVTFDTDWQTVAGTYSTPAGCAPSMCAAGVGNAVQLFARQISMAGYKAVSWTAKLDPTPPVPGGLANSAPVLLRLGSGDYVYVVRGKNGHIFHRSVYQGGTWTDEGGATKAGSQFGCVANNEQPVCFVQGDDGRLYWRKFGTASGL